MIGLGWIQPLDASNDPQPAREPHRAAARPAVGPRPRVPRPLAERPDRHRLQRREDRRGGQLRGAAHPCRPQGPDHPAHRDARHDGLHAQGRSAPTPATSTTTTGPTPSTGCDRWSPTARCARSPATSTSRTSPPGNIVACEAWSGDVIQAQFDNPDIKFVAPEEGLSLWSDNMLVPNLADAPGQRRGLDRLLLPARRRREARRLGQLHLSRPGRPGGDGEDRPLAGREPADLPRRRDPRRDVRLHAARRGRAATKYEGEFADVTGG